MDSLRQIFSRLVGRFQRRNLEAEMAEEMRQHLERRTREKIADGLVPDEAHYAAQREFGGIAQVQERCRDERRFIWEQFFQDVSYGVRSLRKSSGFTATAILTLALGIGVNTSIFSLVNGLLLRSLPVKTPEQLVLFRQIAGVRGRMARTEEGSSAKDPGSGRATGTSFPLLALERFRAQSTLLSDAFAFSPLDRLIVSINGQPEGVVTGQLISGNYYTGLGVAAALGRTLSPADDQASAEPVAVISYRYWERRFDRDPAILGKTIQLNQVSVTIVGVSARGFDGTMQVGESADISAPLAHQPLFEPGRSEKNQPWYWWLRIMGRLAPGVTAAQARAGLEPIFQGAAREGWQIAHSLASTPARDVPDEPQLAADPGAQGENDTRREFAPSLRILLALVSLVLLAACANVANLLLARGASRQREFALRLALGASRARIVRQLVVESMLLAFGGAALGLIAAGWSRDLLLALQPLGNSLLALELPLDGRVLAFASAGAIGTALLFGILPAVRSTRVDLVAEFQGGTRSLGGGRRSRLSQTLMIVQVALSFVLLVSTGLFVRTLRNLQAVDAGFNRSGLALFRLDFSAAGFRRDQVAALCDRLQGLLEKAPGVGAVTYTDVPLLSRIQTPRNVSVQGYAVPPGGSSAVSTNAIAPNFFSVTGLRLAVGRAFSEGDGVAAPKVAIVNRAFAKKFLGSENPVGHRFNFGSSANNNLIEIVGLAGDAKYMTLRDEIPPTVYLPAAQAPYTTMNFAVRTAGNPSAAFPSIRAAVRDLDPTLPVTHLRTMDEQFDLNHARERLFARMSGLFGGVALILACVGLYGLMSYTVLRRTSEIGLRMALGGLPAHMLRMVLRESLTVVGLGIALGVIAAWAASRLISALLFHLSATDPLTYSAAAVLLLTVGVIAALLPARRAAKINPIVALRAE